MGAIRLAITNSTDEEYGGTTATIKTRTLTQVDFSWQSVQGRFQSNSKLSEIIGDETLVSISYWSTNNTEPRNIYFTGQNYILFYGANMQSTETFKILIASING